MNVGQRVAKIIVIVWLIKEREILQDEREVPVHLTLVGIPPAKKFEEFCQQDGTNVSLSACPLGSLPAPVLTVSTLYSFTATSSLTRFLEARNQYLLLRGGRMTQQIYKIYVLHFKNGVIKIVINVTVRERFATAYVYIQIQLHVPRLIHLI